MPSAAFPPRLSAMINTESIAAGMSALHYLSFRFALRVLFVKGKWDHKSVLQRARGREDRNFQQVAVKEMLPRTGFSWKEVPAKTLSRYMPCGAVVTAKSVSLFLAGARKFMFLHYTGLFHVSQWLPLLPEFWHCTTRPGDFLLPSPVVGIRSAQLLPASPELQSTVKSTCQMLSSSSYFLFHASPWSQGWGATYCREELQNSMCFANLLHTPTFKEYLQLLKPSQTGIYGLQGFQQLSFPQATIILLINLILDPLQEAAVLIKSNNLLFAAYYLWYKHHWVIPLPLAAASWNLVCLYTDSTFRKRS